MKSKEKTVYLVAPQKDDFIKNATIITDTGPVPPLHSGNFILKHINGKNTLPTFKYLLATGDYKIIVIFVSNYEAFLDDFCLFKDFNLQILDIKPKQKDMVTAYTNYEIKYRAKHKIKTTKKDLKRAVEISTNPDTLSSIQTSLERPEMYHNNCKCVASEIYQLLLEGPKSYDELDGLIDGSITKHLKSLLFCNVIECRKEIFKIKLNVL